MVDAGKFLDLLNQLVCVWVFDPYIARYHYECDHDRVLGYSDRLKAPVRKETHSVIRILQSHRSVIVLNEALPCDIIRNLVSFDVPIIAADGAKKRMAAWGLAPTHVIGDGDSGGDGEENFIRIPDQDTTDFEKCVMFAREKMVLPALVLGVNGGEIDHILGNIQVMMKHAPDGDLYFLDTYRKDGSIGIKLGIPIAHRSLTVRVPLGSMISLIASNETIITSKGLRWELSGHTFFTDGILGLRNQANRESITLNVERGRALSIFDISEHAR